MRLNRYICAFLSAVAVSNAYGVDFPVGTFDDTTVLVETPYTTPFGGFGSQIGSQVFRRFILINPNTTISALTALDYTDNGTNGSWMAISTFSPGTITIGMDVVSIRSRFTTIASYVSDPSSFVNINLNTLDTINNFITNRFTGSFTDSLTTNPLLAAPIVYGGAAGGTVTVSNKFRIISNSGSASNLAIYAVPSINFVHNATINSTGKIMLLNGGNITFSNTSGLNGAIESSGGTLNVNFNSTGGLTGAITGAGLGTITVGAAGNVTPGSTISSIPNYTINGTFTSGGAMSGVNGAVSISGTGTLNLGHTMSGAGTISNSGILNVNATDALGLTGLFTNSATTNIVASLSRSGATTNTGTISISGSRTFTNTGALNGSGGTMSGAGAFTNTSPGAYTITGSNALNFTGTFTNSGTLNVNGSASRSSATTNTGTIAIANTFTFTNTGALNGSGGTMSGAGAFTNTSPGAYTITGSNALNFTGTFTNSGTLNVNGNASRSSATTNTGTIAIGTNFTFSNSGTLTGTGGTMNGGGGFTNTGTYTTDATAGLSFTGTFTNTSPGLTNLSASLTRANATVNTGIIAINAGTFTNSGAFTSANGILNGVGAFTNSGTYILNSSNGLAFTGLFTNSGTTSVTGTATRANTTTNTGTISISNGVTFTNSGTMTLSPGSFSTIGAMTGAGGAFANTGTFDFNDTTTYTATGGALNFTGLLTNSGTFNVNQNLSRASNTTNTAGTFTVATTKTFTNTGTFSLSGGTLTSTGSFTNGAAGTFAYTGGTINGVGLFTNSGTIDISTGTFDKATGTFTNTGTINISGTGALTEPAGFTNSGTTNINRSGNAITGAYSGTTGSILNIGPVTASAFTTAGAISGIPTINIANDSSLTSSATENITGVNTAFNVGTSSGGGATATFAAQLTGTGVINNFGTMTFGTSSVLGTGFSAINMFSDSTFTLNNGVTTILTTTPITAGDSITGTTLNITGASTVLRTGTLINNIKNITVGTNSTLQLDSGGQITGNNTSGGRTLNLAGTLTIASGGSFTISTSDIINGTTATNGVGDGSIFNSGTLLIDGSDLTLGDDFTNDTTGVFTINGVPTLSFSGDFTNSGTLFATFNESNDIPQIVTSSVPNLASGLIVIGYQDNYIAGGTYPFITGFSGALPGGVGAYSLPQPSTYIAGWSLTADTNSVDIVVDRLGFGEVATDPEAKEIGYYLETLGENNPSQEILDLLNFLEHITDPAELNAALLALAIPEYVPLQSLNMIQDVLNTVQGRIAHVRTGFSVGDVDRDRAVWIRPFVSSGRQQQKDNLQGYTARVNGFAFGLDNDITDSIMLGAAGSIAKSKVTDQLTVNSSTNISSYQAMIYGTVRSKSDGYLDWIIAGGVNNYHGTRGITTDIFTAEYSGQQFTMKAIASKSYVWKKYYQLTPLASAQYSFLRQMPFAEVGNSGLGRVVTPSNVNLLELGVGGQASVPFSQKKVTSIPEIHAMVLVDVKGGALDTNSQFISGGPILSTSVQPGRLIGRVGASLTFAVSDQLQIIANYDFEARSKYISNEVYVNVKYTF